MYKDIDFFISLNLLSLSTLSHSLSLFLLVGLQPQGDLELIEFIILLRMTLNFCFFCLHLPHAILQTCTTIPHLLSTGDQTQSILNQQSSNRTTSLSHDVCFLSYVQLCIHQSTGLGHLSCIFCMILPQNICSNLKWDISGFHMNIATPLIPILNRNDQSREYYYGVEGTFQTGYYDEQSRKLSF